MVLPDPNADPDQEVKIAINLKKIRQTFKKKKNPTFLD
jgi:hypothetical protein